MGLSKDSHVRMGIEEPWWWVCIPTHDMTLSLSVCLESERLPFLIVGCLLRKLICIFNGNVSHFYPFILALLFWNNISYSRCPLNILKVFLFQMVGRACPHNPTLQTTGMTDETATGNYIANIFRHKQKSP